VGLLGLQVAQPYPTRLNLDLGLGPAQINNNNNNNFFKIFQKTMFKIMRGFVMFFKIIFYNVRS
jgi:hypothetical protein